MRNTLPCGHGIHAIERHGGNTYYCGACRVARELASVDVAPPTRNYSREGMGLRTDKVIEVPITRWCPRFDMCECWITHVLCTACEKQRWQACLCAKDKLPERRMRVTDYVILKAARGWKVVDVLVYTREHKEDALFSGDHKACVKWIEKNSVKS